MLIAKASSADDVIGVIKALANDKRLQILAWLKDPRAHFPPQVDGDLVRDGVCGILIANKLGISQPTASEHLKVLSRAGLVQAKRIKQWTFYKRNEKRIAEVKRALRSEW
jgi:DNA-binding transcriptional ArsR family regulator